LSEKVLEDAYIEEALIADVQADICSLLAEKRVSRAELARRMGVSAAYISQMLGDEGGNLTLRTIARVYDAVGERAAVRRVSKDLVTLLERATSAATTAGNRWSH